MRFIDGKDVANKPAIKENPVPIKKQKTAVESVQLVPASAIATTSAAVRTKFIPRSMSAVEMLRLGKERKSTHDTTEIRIYEFDLGNMSWAPTPNKVDFVIGKDPIGTAGFRQAFKATSQTKGFDKVPWVVKKNLNKTVDDIEYLGQYAYFGTNVFWDIMHIRSNIYINYCTMHSIMNCVLYIQINILYKQ